MSNIEQRILNFEVKRRKGKIAGLQGLLDYRDFGFAKRNKRKR